MIDNSIYWGNPPDIDVRRVTWKRVLDMNDRALRQIVGPLGGVANGFPRESGFDITVASRNHGHPVPRQRPRQTCRSAWATSSSATPASESRCIAATSRPTAR